MLTDKFGGRFVSSTLHLVVAVPCFLIAGAQTYYALAFYAFGTGRYLVRGGHRLERRLVSGAPAGLRAERPQRGQRHGRAKSPGRALRCPADTEGRFTFTAFAEEPRPAYDRVHLSEYFSTQNAEALSLASLGWFDEQGVTLHLSDGVSAIDRENKTVNTHQGKVLAYDKLVLATGSAPFIPPVPGIKKTGVFAYRTTKDVDAIIAYRCTKSAVISGGLLGL